MIYQVFYDNAYDSTDYLGEFTREELARLLRRTGYDHLDRRYLTVIGGQELSPADIDSIAAEE